MYERIVTEVVEFEIVEGLEEDKFLKIVDFLEVEFHSKQKGFIDTEIMKGREERSYIMIQHWKTMNDCKAVVQKMMNEPLTESFRNSINPKSVKIVFSEQIQKWR
jgi:heme-degrading monooxygenase HmoA